MDKYSLNGEWAVSGWWKNQWRLQASMELNDLQKAAVPRVNAQVPGAVQLDLMRAGLLSDPFIGTDSIKGEWVNNREWIFDIEFILPDDFSGEKYALIFEGLDFCGEIHLNGNKIRDFSGMFEPVEIDVTAILKTEGNNFLRVIFYQTPEVDGQFGYTSRIKLIKSRYNYIWDWCPRIVPVGFWDDLYIKAYNRIKILDFYPHAMAEEDKTGRINVDLKLESAISDDYRILCTAYRDSVKVAAAERRIRLMAARQNCSLEIKMGPIDLWWPNGEGGQPLYEVRAEVVDSNGLLCDHNEKRVGFRSIRLVQNENAPAGALPYTMEVNGRRIFLKGVNWVPVSPFYGAVTKEQYYDYIQRFRNMNCNLLRVWGGAILEKEAFYDVCDELGMLVWQEFPQSSSGIDNTPSDDPDFVNQLEKVARVYVYKKRHHASHAVWCGGNELMWENYVPVNENHINIRMLKEVVKELDSSKSFLPCSASGPSFVAVNRFGEGVHHDVHGPWTYSGPEEHYQYFNTDDALFRSETGCPGTSRLETLDKYKGDYSVWPPDTSNLYWIHRGAWWIQYDDMKKYFGQWDEEGGELDKYLKLSRYLQMEALRYAAEATVRRWPQASGLILWMGNEPFPNTANTSLVEYDGTPKPAYEALKKAFSGIHVSAAYERLFYNIGDMFKADLYFINERGLEGNGVMEYRILDIYGECLVKQDITFDIGKGARRIARLLWEVRPCPCHVFILDMNVKIGLVSAKTCSNTYVFTVDAPEYPMQPLKMLPDAEIFIERMDGSYGKWIIGNSSKFIAVNVFLYGIKSDEFCEIDPNCFNLLPGEKKVIKVYRKMCGANEEIPFVIEALNR
jgi:Beta-galactosidase/beta-glucuronidase